MMKSVKRQEYFIITVNLIFDAHPIKIIKYGQFHLMHFFCLITPAPSLNARGKEVAHWDLCGIRVKKNYLLEI